MNAIGTVLTLIAALTVMLASRRAASLGVYGAICYITQGQVLHVGGFHFTAIRIVLLAGFVRGLLRGEFRRIDFTAIDGFVLSYAIYSEAVEGYRKGVWQEQVGILYNILLAYFVFRCLVTNWQEVRELMPGVALLIIPLALFMVQNSLTGANVFNLLGGAERVQDWTREGRYRCVGSFRGPHTAGVFGATLIPLFVGCYFMGSRRRTMIAGLIAATAITYTSNSSGPLIAYLSGTLALFFWKMRRRMRMVRWGVVAALLILGLSMKSPIWYLMSKMSDITGGDGWYRSYLMEQCYNHFSDWWAVGTDDTAGWAVTHLSTGGADLCNMYVACAAAGGLGSLLLFIAILSISFGRLGRALMAAREGDAESEPLLWCLGSVLFAHVVTFTSVTYWDQMEVAWWASVAFIAGCTSGVLDRSTASMAVGRWADGRGSEQIETTIEARELSEGPFASIVTRVR